MASLVSGLLPPLSHPNRSQKSSVHQRSKMIELSTVHVSTQMFSPPNEETVNEPVLPEFLFVAPIQWTHDEAISTANTPANRPLECPPSRLFVPLPQRCKTIQNSLGTGHPGANTTLSLNNDSGGQAWRQMCEGSSRSVVNVPSQRFPQSPFRKALPAPYAQSSMVTSRGGLCDRPSFPIW